MTIDVLEKLSSCLRLSSNAEAFGNSGPVGDIPAAVAAKIVHFLDAYSQLDFGWKFALAAHKGEVTFPSFLQNEDLYLWRAYRFMRGSQDEDIRYAVALASPQFKSIRDQIEALLLCKGATCEMVAYNTKVPVGAVRAYEKLFYNILDRKEEAAFLAQVVYPNTRLDEAYDSYLENADTAQLMRRAGYSKGYDYVLYCAGLADSPYEQMSATDGAKELDKSFMSTAIALSAFGWGKSAKHQTAINVARQSMQAAKLGGNNAEDNTLMPALFANALEGAIDEYADERMGAVLDAQDGFATHESDA